MNIKFFVMAASALFIMQGCSRFLSYNILVTKSEKYSQSEFLGINDKVLDLVKGICLDNGFRKVRENSDIPAGADAESRTGYKMHNHFFTRTELGWISVASYKKPISVYIEITSWGVESYDEKIYIKIYEALAPLGLENNINIRKWKGYITDKQLKQACSSLIDDSKKLPKNWSIENAGNN
ncbi:hypothetical protein [Sedimentisphaera salicampi]|uniref:Uncharacterized protein n=1 Tax=Sedimentisphaera salicampi TaxID=1941349 RepID=A0A1W6LMG9_9BACT|nr:hypothetical protein [Sedimentisphaera salicampi]ARN56988.1 hypothetical protein STSP1_01381 [Sedimentisphaera salicampi]